jgi:hypothetical protein
MSITLEVRGRGLLHYRNVGGSITLEERGRGKNHSRGILEGPVTLKVRGRICIQYI